MKANEIPEKIYVPTAGLEMTDKLPCHIEYTRTDAFIEKTEKFLKSYRRETPDKTGYIPGIVDDKMIEDFRNFLKGE
jgi:hypothetical protein